MVPSFCRISQGRFMYFKNLKWQQLLEPNACVHMLRFKAHRECCARASVMAGGPCPALLPAFVPATSSSTSTATAGACACAAGSGCFAEASAGVAECPSPSPLAHAQSGAPGPVAGPALAERGTSHHCLQRFTSFLDCTQVLVSNVRSSFVLQILFGQYARTIRI